MLLKKKRNFITNILNKKFKIILILSGYLLVFIFGAYLQKNHFFYTTLKPLLFQNVKFVEKYLQGKLQKIDKIYIDIEFENYQKLQNNRNLFIKKNKIVSEQNEWVTANIKYNNKNFESRIRLKGRDPDTHLNSTMRNKNSSFKVKIKNKEKGNILGLREFNLMDLRRRGYLLEWYAREFLKNEGLIHLKYKFVNLFINGNDHGTYVLDENFSETTLTLNKRRSGVAVRFDNQYALDTNDPAFRNSFRSASYDNLFSISEIDLLNDNISNFKEEILNNSSSLNKNEFAYFNINGTEKKVILGPDKSKLDAYFISTFLLNNFRDHNLKFEEVFDVDQMAKGFAASDILDGWHGINWTNLSFYLNPVTNKLEPIFQDWYNEGFISEANDNFRGIRILDLYNFGDFYEKIFDSELFVERYVYYLERYSSDNYLNSFNKKISKQLNINLKKIYKSSPYYNFPYYLFDNKIKSVQNFLNHHDPVYLELLRPVVEKNSDEKKLSVKIGNKHVLPIYINKITFISPNGEIFEKLINKKLQARNLEIFNKNQFDKSPIKYNKIFLNNMPFDFYESVILNFKILGSQKQRFKKINYPTVFTEINLENNDFLKLSNEINTTHNFKFIKTNKDYYIINEGDWFIKEDLLIPRNKKLIIKKGTNITLMDKARIISKSPIIAIGEINKMINIISDDGRCIVISETKELSVFENVNFTNLQNCDRNGINSEGSLNVYNSEVKMKNIIFYKNLKGDDGINFVNSRFDLDSILFRDVLSDCLDIDYSIGHIKNINFQNCGNDGLDISNSTLNLINFESFNTGDKGISSGENSVLIGDNIKINNSFMGIGIKDGSEVQLNNVEINNSKIPLAAYIKKQTYSYPEIKVTNYNYIGDEKEIIEQGIISNINNKIYVGESKNVFEKIYK